jgi:hypothetical protein
VDGPDRALLVVDRDCMLDCFNIAVRANTARHLAPRRRSRLETATVAWKQVPEMTCPKQCLPRPGARVPSAALPLKRDQGSPPEHHLDTDLCLLVISE